MSHGRTSPQGLHRARGRCTAPGLPRAQTVSGRVRRRVLVSCGLLGWLVAAGAAAAAPPAPTLTPEIPAAINTTPTITLSATGATGYSWLLDTKPGLAATVPLSGLGDGTHTLTAVAINRTGPSTATTRSFVLDRVDPTAPTVTPALPALTNQPPTAVTLGGGGEPVTYRWRLDANPFQTGPAVALGVLADGTHTLTANAIDVAGNISPATARTMRVDRQAPTPPTISPALAAGTLFKAFPVSTLAGGGEPVTYQWRIDDGAPRTGAAVTATDVADGEHRITASATDEAQNRSTEVTWTFRIERSAPAPPILSAPAVGLSARRSELTAVAPTGTLQWSLTGPRSLKGEGNDALRSGLGAIPDGEYALSATTRSVLGSISGPSVLTFKLDATPPPKPAVDSGPTSSRGGPTPRFAWLLQLYITQYRIE